MFLAAPLTELASFGIIVQILLPEALNKLKKLIAPLTSLNLE